MDRVSMNGFSRNSPFGRGYELYRSFIFQPMAALDRLSRCWPFDTGPVFNRSFKFQPMAVLDELSRNWLFFFFSVATTLKVQSAR